MSAKENIQIKNADNVAMYRRDIEKATGRVLAPDESNASLIGCLFGSDMDYLESLGLLNRGFCPYCGGSPIVDQSYSRSN